MFYSIIGDIVSSKSLDERSKIQNELQHVIDEVNQKYGNHMEKRIAITLGDEFQGLFNSFESVFEIIHFIMVKMWPTKIRFGIGIGDIAFNLSDINNPYNSDGSVWWNARKAIDDIKKLNSKNNIMDVSNIRLNTDNKNLNLLINSSLNMCFAISEGWTEPQRDLIFHIIKNYGLTDNFVKKELAKSYEQGESTVYNKLKISKYYYYNEVIKNITNYILNIEGESKL